MYNIEKYSEGKMDRISLSLFERKMKQNKTFKEKVLLYQNIDSIMSGAALAKASELEMIEKNIDMVAAGFINDFHNKNEKPVNIQEYLNWS